LKEILWKFHPVATAVILHKKNLKGITPILEKEI